MEKREYACRDAKSLVGKYIVLSGGSVRYFKMGKVVEANKSTLTLKPNFSRSADEITASEYSSVNIYFEHPDGIVKRCKIITKAEFDKVYKAFKKMDNIRDAIFRDARDIYYD